MRRLTALLMALAVLVAPAGAEIDLSSPAPQATPAPVELSGSALLDAPPFALDCAAALLLEPQSGQIIFEMNADSPRAVASVIKVMTILLALEAVDAGRVALSDMVTVSEDAAGMGGSQVLLDIGEAQTFDVLLKSAIVGSANDAAVAIAEALYGSEALCVERMNERAAQLGMADTHFVNCTGLPAEGQQTSDHSAPALPRSWAYITT